MGLKKEQPSQRRFIPVNGGLELESDHDFGVRRSVSNLPLVRELNGAPIQIVDLRDEGKVRSVVDPQSWNERKKRGERTAGVLIRAENPVSEDQIREVSAQVRRDGGVVIIVEEKPLSLQQREERARLLSGKIRLAKVQVSNKAIGPNDEVTISSSRRRRTPKRRKPVDISKTKSRFTVAKGLAQVRQTEQEGGVIEVDDREARGLMAASSNLRRDVTRLADGGGRLLRYPCGCQVKYGLNGTYAVVMDCGRDDRCLLRDKPGEGRGLKLSWDQLLNREHVIPHGIEKRKVGSSFRQRGKLYKVMTAEAPSEDGTSTRVIKVAVRIGKGVT